MRLSISLSQLELDQLFLDDIVTELGGAYSAMHRVISDESRLSSSKAGVRPAAVVVVVHTSVIVESRLSPAQARSAAAMICIRCACFWALTFRVVSASAESAWA